jgi:transposase
VIGEDGTVPSPGRRRHRGVRRHGACRQYDLHWLTLKKILSHEEPPGYRRTKPPRRSKVDPVLPVIRQILADDAKAPRKQRHTARRIWQRLRDEHGFTGGYTTVKDAVRQLQVGREEVFLPLSHPPGEAQVDFGFAEVIVRGVPTRVALFVMSLPYSDAVYVQAFPRECAEVFLEGHARAFAFLGGVPMVIGLGTGSAIGATKRNTVAQPLRAAFRPPQGEKDAYGGPLRPNPAAAPRRPDHPPNR